MSSGLVEGPVLGHDRLRRAMPLHLSLEAMDMDACRLRVMVRQVMAKMIDPTVVAR